MKSIVASKPRIPLSSISPMSKQKAENIPVFTNL